MGRFFTISFIILTNVNLIYSQSITLTSPNGGETLNYGTSFNISWTSSGLADVNIDYSINGGVNWTNIASNVPTPGSYLWVIPNAPTTQALIKISKNSISDISNSFFFIKSPQFNPADTIKILALGNSITFDGFRAEMRFVQDKISYRGFLWDSLRTNNYNFDFIGHNICGYYQFPDPHFNGVPGIRDDQMASFLSSGYDPISQMQVTAGNYLNAFTPNLVLLHLGTNGVNDPGGTSAADIENILNLIDAKSPDIWVVLALIIDMVPNSSNVTSFNNNVRNMAQARIDAGDKILIVNMQTDAGLVYINDTTPPFNGDMYDGLHPNDSGKLKMSNLWFKALQLILPSSTTSAPNITSIPDTFAHVGLPYRYDVNASGVGAPDYSLTFAPFGMTINSKTGIIDWTPTATGIFQVSVKAANSSGEAFQNYNIEVLNQPLLTNNLISYWRMDENGTPSYLIDLPGVNDAQVITPITPSIGIVNGSQKFSGSTRVNILDDSSMYFYPSESFSIETWVKTTQSGGGEKIFVGKGGGYTKYSLGMNSSNQAKFEIEDSSGAITSVIGPTINDGNWHHIVGVVDRANNRLRIYVDSVRTNTTKTFHPSGFFSYDPLNFGYLHYSNYFDGYLDEIAIYNRALTQSEIANHYRRGKFYGKGYFDQFVLAKLKIFLDGPFTDQGDSMLTQLRVNNYIPLTSPYLQDQRTVTSIPFGVVDWVLIELRSLASGGTVGYRSAFLKSNGMIVGDDGSTEQIIVDVPPGNYYTVIRHRNHLSVMSKDPISFNDFTSSPVLYDFTTSINKFYGTDGAKEIKTGVWGMWAGDVNNDGVIKYNLANNDRSLILQRIGGSDINDVVNGYYPEDINMDGLVKYNLSNNDRAVILMNIGGSDINATKVTQVP